MVSEENPYAGQGAVLLDIGGEVGALVVSMPADLTGVEVEIARRGAGRDHAQHSHDQHSHDHSHHDHGHDTHRPHVAVVPRPVTDGVMHSLVFPELLEGDYELYRRPDGPVELTVSITGGGVTEAAWPAR